MGTRVITVTALFMLAAGSAAANGGSCPADRAGVLDSLGGLFGTIRELIAIAPPGHERPSSPPCADARGADGGEPLRALSYNVKAGRDSSLDEIAKDIRAMDADFVALQEIDVNTGRTGRVDQTAELSRKTGMRHHAFGKAIDHDGGAYGVALLSKHPIVDVAQTLLPGAGERRTILCGTVQVPSGDVRVCSTHLGLGSGDRARQASAIADFLGDEHARFAGRVLLMGDLNDVPGSETLELLANAGLRDAGTRAATHPSTTPSRKIDYVLAGDGMTATCSAVPRTTASDHRPLLATF